MLLLLRGERRMFLQHIFDCEFNGKGGQGRWCLGPCREHKSI